MRHSGSGSVPPSQTCRQGQRRAFARGQRPTDRAVVYGGAGQQSTRKERSETCSRGMFLSRFSRRGPLSSRFCSAAGKRLAEGVGRACAAGQKSGGDRRPQVERKTTALTKKENSKAALLSHSHLLLSLFLSLFYFLSLSHTLPLLRPLSLASLKGSERRETESREGKGRGEESKRTAAAATRERPQSTVQSKTRRTGDGAGVE